MRTTCCALIAMLVAPGVNADGTRIARYVAHGFDGVNVFQLEQRFEATGAWSEADYSLRASYCGPSSAYVCAFIQEAPFLSVPKKGLKVGAKWTFAEFPFRVVALREGMFSQAEKAPFPIQLLSTSTTVFAIQSGQPPNGRVVLYSRENGVIGYTGNITTPYFGPTDVPHATTGFYWLVGTCGIGCKDFDESVPVEAQTQGDRPGPKSRRE